MSNQPRDPTAFLYFTPGVTGGTVNGGSGLNQMNGGQSNLNETYIDGVAMDDVNQQSDWAVVHSTFSVDAVEQAQGVTSGASAAYQGQGLQNYVHKSGTNIYHGTAFEYFRNTALDGWGFYAPYVLNAVTGKAIKPIEHNNEFGGTFGGYIPHFKNKVFFFASFETEHLITGTNPSYASVPSLLERAGDFTDLPVAQPIYDPSTTVCSGSPTVCVGNSNYSSLQLALKQRDIRGFSYGLTYTFAKTYDDAGNARSAYGYNGKTAGQEEHALSTIDIPSNVTLYYIYNLPFEASLFNVDGHVDFSGPNTTFSSVVPNGSTGSNAFGTVTGQANKPRDAQLSARFDF